MSARMPSSPPDPSAPGDRTRVFWAVGIGVLIAVAIAVLLVLVLLGDTDTDTRAEQSVQDVADAVVAATQAQNLDAGLGLLCDQAVDSEIERMRIFVGTTATGTGDDTYDVSELAGGAAGSFTLRVVHGGDAIRPPSADDDLDMFFEVMQAGDGSCVSGLVEDGHA